MAMLLAEVERSCLRPKSLCKARRQDAACVNIRTGRFRAGDLHAAHGTTCGGAAACLNCMSLEVLAKRQQRERSCRSTACGILPKCCPVSQSASGSR